MLVKLDISKFRVDKYRFEIEKSRCWCYTFNWIVVIWIEAYGNGFPLLFLSIKVTGEQSRETKKKRNNGFTFIHPSVSPTSHILDTIAQIIQYFIKLSGQK